MVQLWGFLSILFWSELEKRPRFQSTVLMWDGISDIVTLVWARVQLDSLQKGLHNGTGVRKPN